MSREGHTIEGPYGAIRIDADALSGLVVASAELVEGARVRRPRRGLDLTVKEGTAKVSLELAAPYGVSLPTLARSVQASVAAALLGSAGLASVVDVSIEELNS
ncbi:MAG TPA: Asp23/Gls24 family envelope stress response protein [Gaiellaceae bacterium]|nr:Asp23/Gls24 family envelope stress response protein [Gaiellaceae bacterium]